MTSIYVFCVAQEHLVNIILFLPTKYTQKLSHGSESNNATFFSPIAGKQIKFFIQLRYTTLPAKSELLFAILVERFYLEWRRRRQSLR
jgi:hypothetical protein